MRFDAAQITKLARDTGFPANNLVSDGKTKSKWFCTRRSFPFLAGLEKIKLLILKEVVGAKGFEPSTSWSRNSISKILKALSGVAYETKEATFLLSVVPNLYPFVDKQLTDLTVQKQRTQPAPRPPRSSFILSLRQGLTTREIRATRILRVNGVALWRMPKGTGSKM
jgi:hypothetical protein